MHATGQGGGKNTDNGLLPNHVLAKTSVPIHPSCQLDSIHATMAGYSVHKITSSFSFIQFKTMTFIMLQ